MRLARLGRFTPAAALVLTGVVLIAGVEYVTGDDKPAAVIVLPSSSPTAAVEGMGDRPSTSPDPATQNDIQFYDPKTPVFTTDPTDMVKPAVDEPGDNEDVSWDKWVFNNYFVGKPYFDCPDGRNAKKTYKDMKTFVPCVNGSALLRLEAGKLTVNKDKAKTTDPRGISLHTATVGEKSDNKRNKTNKWDITLRSQTVKEPISETKYKDVTYYLVGYNSVPEYAFFEIYTSVNGAPWKLQVNLNDKSWSKTDKVDILLTWQDPTKKMKDAPIPFGTWDAVSKNSLTPSN